MFTRNVADNRVSMINFLTKHFRYYTSNPWNRSTSYANNVKLQNLEIPDELREKAYDFIGLECPEYQYAIQELINDFRHETGYDAGFNGRSSGYIVLYKRERDRLGRPITVPGRSIDADTDFKYWSINELKERVNLVCRFDKLCNDIRDTFLWYLENSEIKEIEVVRTEKQTVVVVNNA